MSTVQTTVDDKTIDQKQIFTKREPHCFKQGGKYLSKFLSLLKFLLYAGESQDSLNSPIAPVIFYFVEQKPPDVQWRNREQRGDKEHHEKVNFFSSR